MPLDMVTTLNGKFTVVGTRPLRPDGIDKVTGRRCTFALFPWNWERGDGCVIRLVAIVDPGGKYRIESGERF